MLAELLASIEWNERRTNKSVLLLTSCVVVLAGRLGSVPVALVR